LNEKELVLVTADILSNALIVITAVKVLFISSVIGGLIVNFLAI
jgi:hypothetical protein